YGNTGQIQDRRRDIFPTYQGVGTGAVYRRVLARDKKWDMRGRLITEPFAEQLMISHHFSMVGAENNVERPSCVRGTVSAPEFENVGDAIVYMVDQRIVGGSRSLQNGGIERPCM